MRTVFEIAQSLQDKIEKDMQFPFRQKEVIRQSFLNDDRMPAIMTQNRLDTLNNRFAIQNRQNTWEDELGYNAANMRHNRMTEEGNIRSFGQRERIAQLEREYKELELNTDINDHEAVTALERKKRELELAQTNTALNDNQYLEETRTDRQRLEALNLQIDQARAAGTLDNMALEQERDTLKLRIDRDEALYALSTQEARQALEDLNLQRQRIDAQYGIDSAGKRQALEDLERDAKILQTKVGMLDSQEIMNNPEAYMELTTLQRQYEIAKTKADLGDLAAKREAERLQREMQNVVNRVKTAEEQATLAEMDAHLESRRLERKAQDARNEAALVEAKGSIVMYAAQEELKRILTAFPDWDLMDPTQQIEVLMPHLNSKIDGVRELVIQKLREGPIYNVIEDLNAIDDFVRTYGGQPEPTTQTERYKRNAAKNRAAEAIGRLNPQQLTMLLGRGIIKNRETTSSTLALIQTLTGMTDPEVKAQMLRDMMNGVDITTRSYDSTGSFSTGSNIPAEAPAQGTGVDAGTPIQGGAEANMPPAPAAPTAPTPDVPAAPEQTAPVPSADVPVQETEPVSTAKKDALLDEVSGQNQAVPASWLDATAKRYDIDISTEPATNEEASAIVNDLITRSDELWSQFEKLSPDLQNAMVQLVVSRIMQLQADFQIQ